MQFSEHGYHPSTTEQRSTTPPWTIGRKPDEMVATSQSGTVRLGDGIDDSGQRVRRLEIVGTLFLQDNQQRPFRLTCIVPFEDTTGLRDFNQVTYEPMANYASSASPPQWKLLYGAYIQQTRLLALNILQELPSQCGAEREEAIALLKQPFAGE